MKKKESGIDKKISGYSTVGILPVRDTVIFPFMVSPLIVGRERSVTLVNEVYSGGKIMGIIPQKRSEVEEPGPGDCYRVGTLCKIHKLVRYPDEKITVIVQGLRRFRVKRFTRRSPYLEAIVIPLDDVVTDDMETEALVKEVVTRFQKIVSLTPFLNKELQMAVTSMKDPGKLADFIISNLDVETAKKQMLLEAQNVKKRLQILLGIIRREIELLELGRKIQSEVHETMSRGMKEHYLREQIRAIQRELGEEDEQTREINEYNEKIERAGLPREAEEAAQRELSRLSLIHPAAAEYTVVKTYLDWLVELPWSVVTKDRLGIRRAKKVLDRDHYDLEKIKERILEYLAVRKLKNDIRGPILCFVGPPGVGKTSLGRSIAAAMGRRFVRISLGGVRDEAEIRGHRRTYVGSLPGRIIQNLRKCGSRNPVFMIDEVDKIGTDFRGDPASALLEVLDPEQNNRFSDHYLEVPFDLSQVMFITTANITDPIPSALLDRMEVINLPGYTEEEKVEIACRHLVPRQLKEHGLTRAGILFRKETLRVIIRDYTREAGLRNLERAIATACRKVARRVAEGTRTRVIISPRNVKRYLGPVRYFSERLEEITEPGIAVGLAWTPVGGEILFVEVKKMPGKKKLTLTGQLGEVMKESAMAAMSFVRAYAGELGIEEDMFARSDIHLHVPAGATPKDGPSAGLAIAAALISLCTGKVVDPTVAMTGEITLAGRILPVGGIKDKMLAARRAGIRKVLLPEENRNDIGELPREVRDALEFAYVKNLSQALRHLFPAAGGKVRRTRGGQRRR